MYLEKKCGPPKDGPDAGVVHDDTLSSGCITNQPREQNQTMKTIFFYC